MRTQDLATINDAADAFARTATDSVLRGLVAASAPAVVRRAFREELERRATWQAAAEVPAVQINKGEEAKRRQRRPPRSGPQTVYHVAIHRHSAGGLGFHTCATPRRMFVIAPEVDVSGFPVDSKDSIPVLTSWVVTGHPATVAPSGGEDVKGARVIYAADDPDLHDYVDRFLSRVQLDLRQFGECRGRTSSRRRAGSLDVSDRTLLAAIIWVGPADRQFKRPKFDAWKAYEKLWKERLLAERELAAERLRDAFLGELAWTKHPRLKARAVLNGWPRLFLKSAALRDHRSRPAFTSERALRYALASVALRRDVKSLERMIWQPKTLKKANKWKPGTDEWTVFFR